MSEDLFPIDIHYNKLLGKTVSSYIYWFSDVVLNSSVLKYR